MTAAIVFDSPEREIQRKVRGGELIDRRVLEAAKISVVRTRNGQIEGTEEVIKRLCECGLIITQDEAFEALTCACAALDAEALSLGNVEGLL